MVELWAIFVATVLSMVEMAEKEDVEKETLI
jgi:hypothetical protein